MPHVLIIGAGPTGATLALLLAQRGIMVTLVEASRTFQRQFRGEGLMPSGLAALEQLGVPGLLHRLPHRPLDAWEFWINQRSLFRVDEPLEPGGRPCTLVSQSALLDALVQEAIAHPTLTFQPASPVTDLLWQGERVGGVRLANGQAIAADLVVGADGRQSVVRQRAALPLESQPHSFDILWFRVADHPRLEAENVFYSILRDRHAFGLFRSSEGTLQVGWALRPEAAEGWKQQHWPDILAATAPPWLADHFRARDAILDGPVLLSVVVGRCPRWSRPGVLLLGDAAHPMSPIRAQGINMGLRDALVAANILVPILQARGDSTAIDRGLSLIQTEREPEIVRVQQLQRAETAQADLLEQSAIARWGASQLAPLIRLPIRQLWQHRQRQLRQGVTAVQLAV